MVNGVAFFEGQLARAVVVLAKTFNRCAVVENLQWMVSMVRV